MERDLSLVDGTRPVPSGCQRLKEKLGYKRQSVPTALEILGLAGLWVFRKLRVRTFG
jgi:hypothetical protein